MLTALWKDGTDVVIGAWKRACASLNCSLCSWINSASASLPWALQSDLPDHYKAILTLLQELSPWHAVGAVPFKSQKDLGMEGSFEGFVKSRSLAEPQRHPQIHLLSTPSAHSMVWWVCKGCKVPLLCRNVRAVCGFPSPKGSVPMAWPQGSSSFS